MIYTHFLSRVHPKRKVERGPRMSAAMQKMQGLLDAVEAACSDQVAALDRCMEEHGVGGCEAEKQALRDCSMQGYGAWG